MEGEDEGRSDGSFELVDMAEYASSNAELSDDGSFEFLCSEVSETLVLTEEEDNNDKVTSMDNQSEDIKPVSSEPAKEEKMVSKSATSFDPKKEVDSGLTSDTIYVPTISHMDLISDKKDVPTNVEFYVSEISSDPIDEDVDTGSASDTDLKEEAEEFRFENGICFDPSKVEPDPDVKKGKKRNLMDIIDNTKEFDDIPACIELRNDLRDVAKNHIIRYLPAKSLARSQLVSRQWNEWISSPFFGHMQCQYFKSTSGFFQDDNSTIRFISLDHNAYGVPRPSLNFLPVMVFIKASCNGLLLCQTCTDESEFYVCNPANKHWIKLPPPSYYHGVNPKIVLAFEPASLNFEPSYQVICPFSLPDPNEGPIVYFDIYDSRTQSWKISEMICVDLHESDVKSNGIFVGGVAYWETTGGEFIAFDVKNEIYGVQALPYGAGGALSKVNGQLCYVKAHYCHQVGTCFIDVYSGSAMSLEDSIAFEVSGIEDADMVECVIVGNPCDDIIGVVVKCQSQSRLYAYIVKEKRAEGPCVLWGPVKLFPYVNSLIPISA